MAAVTLEPAPVPTDANGTYGTSVARPGVRRDTLAAKTVLLYAGDWARFAAFCAASGARALPAAPETVIAFLDAGVARTAGRRWLAAIDARHRQFALPCPGDDPQVRHALKRARAAAPHRSRPPLLAPAVLHGMAGRCRRDLAGVRDRAVLLLLAGGVARTALVGLQAETLRWGEDGVRAQTLWIPRAAQHDRCPVRALEDWLRASATRYGPVFRKVTRWGTVEPAALGADAVRRILARHSN